jgi:hypothetical protein
MATRPAPERIPAGLRRKAILTWPLLAATAIANGAARQTVIEPAVGELTAHQISCATASAAFLGVSWLMLRHEAARASDHALLRVGLAWAAATEVFEFGFGHYLAGSSWRRLLRDDNVAQGRFWAFVLLVIFVAPLAVKRWTVTRLSRPSRQK